MERLHRPDKDFIIDVSELIDPSDDLLVNNNTLPLSSSEKDRVRVVLDELDQERLQKQENSPLGIEEPGTSSFYGPYDPLSSDHETILTRAYKRIAEELKTTTEEIKMTEDTEVSLLETSLPDNTHRQELETLRNKVGEKLFLHNIGLVFFHVNKHFRNSPNHEDLVQEANMGLLHAIEKFNPELGNRFSTYATFWIRQRLFRGVNKDKLIKIPPPIRKQVREIKRIEQSLADSLQRDPNNEELAAAVGISTEKLEELMSYDHLSFIRSLNAPIRNGEESKTLEDTIPDPDSLDDKSIQFMEVREGIVELFEGLTEREKDILTKRHGLESSNPQSLSEIGEKLGLTKQRISQIERGALRKIRLNLIRKKRLKNY